jgi:hypothetical protein
MCAMRPCACGTASGRRRAPARVRALSYSTGRILPEYRASLRQSRRPHSLRAHGSSHFGSFRSTDRSAIRRAYPACAFKAKPAARRRRRPTAEWVGDAMVCVRAQHTAEQEAKLKETNDAIAEVSALIKETCAALSSVVIRPGPLHPTHPRAHFAPRILRARRMNESEPDGPWARRAGPTQCVRGGLCAALARSLSVCGGGTAFAVESPAVQAVKGRSEWARPVLARAACPACARVSARPSAVRAPRGRRAYVRAGS